MTKTLLASVAAALLAACVSVESTPVSPSDVAAHGEPVAVIQATSIGFTALFHFVDIVPSDLDQVVNGILVKEVKAMGANKVDLKTASTTPRHGIFALYGFLIGFPSSQAVGVAVK